MALVLQIVLAVVLLMALVTIILSAKTWHWSQVVLVLFILIFGTTALVLGTEVYRIHRNLRAGIPRLEQQIAAAEELKNRLVNGAPEEPGIRELEHRLQLVTRERGRVWRGATPTSEVADDGKVSVTIPNPQPHGLAEDTIVYAFETGDPGENKQYLGEFRVVESGAEGVTLDPVPVIDARTGDRLVASEGPWSLYETMPADRPSLFAGLSAEQLREMLPEESVEEYIRQGSEATADDDEWHVIGLDENDQRVGPDQMDQAVKRLFDRPLRDYAYLFEEFGRQRAILLAAQDAAREDNAKLEAALASAKQLSQFRQQEITALSSDLEGMETDLAAVVKHLKVVQRQLSNAQQLVTDLLADNSARARQLAARQMQWLSEIDAVAPAADRASTLSP